MTSIQHEVSSGTRNLSNDSLVRMYVEEVLNTRFVELLPRIFSPDFVDHNPVADGQSGIEGIYRYVRLLSEPGFDLKFTLEDLVVDRDRVAYRLFGEGPVDPTRNLTTQGPPAASNEQRQHILYESIGIYRVVLGKLKEHWGLRRFYIGPMVGDRIRRQDPAHP